MTAAAKSSAAPTSGVSIKAAAPAVSTEVRYRQYREYPYYSDWGLRTEQHAETAVAFARISGKSENSLVNSLHGSYCNGRWED
jgi:hypothetical protein